MPRNGQSPAPRGSVLYKDPEKRREGSASGAPPIGRRSERWTGSGELQISTKSGRRTVPTGEANREKVRAEQREYQAAKRAKAKERNPDAIG
jgi:hypothetical protein